MKPLSRRFYARGTVELARALIGRMLLRQLPEGAVGGRIVETEAYDGPEDPGSHAFRGRTPRNSVMFGPPGHLYVYFTYGMHYCANVVAESDGVPGAVLLRAVEPIEGLDIMSERRGTEVSRDLARGPGRLCKAFGLDRSMNGADLTQGAVWIEGRPRLRADIQTSSRIGVKVGTEFLWRFYEPGPWTSGPAAMSRPLRR